MGFKPGNKLGGKRKNAGRKPDEFREKCAELANSPKFFIWAKEVFDGKEVECRLTKTGDLVYFPASTGDRVYLWEKLAAYGFGKATEEGANDPKDSVKNAEAAYAILKILEKVADGVHVESGSGRNSLGMDPGAIEIQAPSAPTNSV